MGDNPDASKALRLLIKDLKLVRREGDGGRADPYLYIAKPQVSYKFSPVINTEDLPQTVVN